ncbi:hypothetical protein OPV22_009113 [Ensete ventricosum]|uniref:Uncharacterized protein n=1 Tax=Ensete ventricosum TaxID=4639 RepID=A0AAV8RE99_ENSVE|nr:hypothetical protein OPV22_009113 [Ensete ventricosum]
MLSQLMILDRQTGPCATLLRHCTRSYTNGPEFSLWKLRTADLVLEMDSLFVLGWEGQLRDVHREDSQKKALYHVKRAQRQMLWAKTRTKDRNLVICYRLHLSSYHL